MPDPNSAMMPHGSTVPLWLLTAVWVDDIGDPITHADSVHNIDEYPSPQALVNETWQKAVEEYPTASVKTSLWQLIDCNEPAKGYQEVCSIATDTFDDAA